MRFSILSLVLLFLIGSTLTSCINYEEVKLTEVRDVKIVNITNNQIETKFRVVINNPNAFDINIDDTDLDFYLNEQKLGKADLIDKFKIQNNSEQEYEFRVKVDATDAVSASLNNVFKVLAKGLQLKVSGTITTHTFIFKRKIPVEVERNLGIGDFIR